MKVTKAKAKNENKPTGGTAKPSAVSATPKSETSKKQITSCYVGKYEHVFEKHWTNEEVSAMADEMLEWMEADKDNYWIEEFLLNKNIPSSSFYDLLKAHNYLKRVHELCKMRREMRLAKASMFDDVNPSGIIFALKNKCGWKDKQEAEQDDSQIEAVDFEYEVIR